MMEHSDNAESAAPSAPPEPPRAEHTAAPAEHVPPPAAEHVTATPPEAVAAPSPVEPVAETPPAEPVAETPPAEPVAETPPTEPAAETPPVAPVAETPPVAPVAETPPVKPVADTPPVAPVAETPPAEPVAETPPVAPVAETPPVEAVGSPEAEPVAAASGEPVPGEVPQPPAAPAVDERRVRAQQTWQRIVDAHESGETVSGHVTAAVKGGLLVDIGGIRGFLPASQVRTPPGTAIETLVKTKLPLKVIDVDTTRRRAVVSQRRVLEEERRASRAELLRSLKVGQVLDVVVVRLADFGAFVDLGGIDGLIPMRELAFERVEKTSDVLNVGDRLSATVIRIEQGGKKIALSRKNALPDPWRDHAGVLRQGSTVTGKVVAKDPQLQVELAPGVIGVVRESDADPADYALGEPIEVSVRSVDRARRRILLTTMHGEAAVPVSTTGFAPLGVELGRRPDP